MGRRYAAPAAPTAKRDRPVARCGDDRRWWELPSRFYLASRLGCVNREQRTPRRRLLHYVIGLGAGGRSSRQATMTATRLTGLRIEHSRNSQLQLSPA